MKKIVLLLLVLNFGCAKNISRVPKSAKISVKYKVLDEEISPNNINCAYRVASYLQMKDNDCSFKIEEFEFDIERKYVLNSNGSLKEYWMYLAEGPLTYSMEQLNDDLKFKSYEELNNFNIKIAEDRTAIIDNNTTFKIERIFKKEKLILIEKGNNEILEGRRILYAYK
ncbi:MULTISPECIES: hypothetical protein [unclassified Cellulophaga]|uniref:hypothetical protein n=1 Tax=unclassified Cellulophaga TaxID=2634405 RepID=UPI0026E17F60|nr:MULTISPECIES: hypothetical protein [unclassified Cellulophaga]MDO6490513.1 hypothetical protein [Cellulophaga sp. 2_MG-2023]MDO6494293.1 hypothetical protein [Cellulophaga sp. 3_MG-2023]